MMIDLAKLMLLIEEGFSTNEISVKLDCHYQTVRSWTKKLPGDKYWIMLRDNGVAAKKQGYRRFNNGRP